MLISSQELLTAAAVFKEYCIYKEGFYVKLLISIQPAILIDHFNDKISLGNREGSKRLRLKNSVFIAK